jgi:hypothetical protein
MTTELTKLYIDIDGVLLKRNGSLANHVKPFLEWAAWNFDCYWATTRDRAGLDGIIAAFKGQLPEPLIHAIKPTRWETLKIEAIDLTSDYLIVDDGLLDIERKAVGEKWLAVNVNRDEDAIIKLWDRLKKVQNPPSLEKGDGMFVPSGAVHSAEVVGTKPVVSVDAPRG